MLEIREKSAQDNLDFPVDFSGVLPLGDTIVTAVWTLPVGAGLTKTHETGAGVQIATAWLEGGVDGEYHTIHCDIVSGLGLKIRKSFVLKILEA